MGLSEERREKLAERRRRMESEDDDTVEQAEVDADRVSVVPFVPPSCPDCGSRSKRTIGRKGIVRYHECIDCGSRYKSLERPPTSVEGWSA